MDPRGAATFHAVPVRGVAETVPVEHETAERVARWVFFAAPPAALALGGMLAWGGSLHWQDLLVLALTYTLTGLGITVGFHRLFTHRSFKTTRTMRALLAVLGSMAVEGPLIEWVATRRVLRGKDMANPARYAKDSVVGGRTGLMWGGAVRVLLLHHVTFSITSLCHLAWDVIRIAPERQRARRGSSLNPPRLETSK